MLCKRDLSGWMLSLVLLICASALADIDQAKNAVRDLFKAGDFAAAETAIEDMKQQFSEDPCLPEALYFVGDEYRWVYKFSEAEQLYRQVLSQYPGTNASQRAELGILRIEALSAIETHDQSRTGELTAEIAADYSVHPDLADTLYWLARECEWTLYLGEAVSAYDGLLRHCPDSSYSDKARMGLARVTVGNLVETGNIAAADAAYEQMLIDFDGNEDLKDTLYWLTKRYEGPNEFERARAIYRTIIQRWPGSDMAQQAAADIDMTYVFALMVQRHYDQAMEALDNFILKYNDYDYIALIVRKAPEEYYYEEGVELKDAGFRDEAAELFTQAIPVFERSIQNFGPSENKAFAYYYSAGCSYYLRDYQSAAAYYERVVTDYPDFVYSYSAYWLLSRCYGMMARDGSIGEEEANDLIASCCWAIVDYYPNCPYAEKARLRLEGMGL